jgi:23S rRNA G2445 N2-methylase RlmL
VTGIDVIPKAVNAASARAREAGVEAEFIQGDLTVLRTTGVGTGYRLLLYGGLFMA